MERYYKKYQSRGTLGERTSRFPLTNGQIDFSETHVQCRDLPCCIAFAVACVIGLAILIYSVAAGKPKLLYNPIDSFDGVCGFDFNSVDNSGKPYLMSGIGKDNDPVNICVSRCPTSENNCVCSNQSSPFPSTSVGACLVDEKCSYYSGEDTEPLMDYCVPQSDKSLANQGESQILRDVVSRIWVCGLALGITAGLCFLYIILLIFFAYYIVWGTIIVSMIGMFLLSVLFFVLAGVMFSRHDEATASAAIAFVVMGILFLLIFLIIACVIFIFRSRIDFCIAIIQEACRGIRALPSLCLIPIFFTLLSAGVYVLYCVALIYFIGTFRVTVANGSRSIEVSTFSDIVLIINFFILMWVSFACIGLAQSVIAGGLAAWYFSHDRDNLSNRTPVASAFYRTFRYSLGTVLAGSGILALIETLKMLANMADDSANRSNNGGNGGLLACCCCCLRCLLQMIEDIMVFISERAYIMASITGKGFIQSCKESFLLLLRNIITTLVLENVKTLPITVGKIFIFLISAFLTLIICNPYIFSSSTSKTGGYVVEYWFIVYIICIVIIFFILQMMTTIITYSIDSIFIFYLIDQEYSRTANQPPFASPDLIDHMGGGVQAAGREMASKYDISLPADSPLPAGVPSAGSSLANYGTPVQSYSQRGAQYVAPPGQQYGAPQGQQYYPPQSGQIPPYAQPSYAPPSYASPSSNTSSSVTAAPGMVSNPSTDSLHSYSAGARAARGYNALPPAGGYPPPPPAGQGVGVGVGVGVGANSYPLQEYPPPPPPGGNYPPPPGGNYPSPPPGGY